MDSRSLHILELVAWKRREERDAIASVHHDKAVAHSTWDTLKSRVASCTACELHQSRTQTVLGVGNTSSPLMLIGEAPGYHEDQQGEPFVGRAGQLLTAMLKAIGFAREQVYIANILKCRPPNNRDPRPFEVSTCTPFLAEQIGLIKPRLIVAVGRIAAHYLLNSKASLESLRNQLHHHADSNTPLIATYHPAYLLRNPSDKKKAYLDLQFILKTLQSFIGDPHGSLSKHSTSAVSLTAR